MLGVGDLLPSFSVKAVAGNKLADMTLDTGFIEVNHQSYPNQWLVLFFYPKDFTFVCPTELAALAELEPEFRDRDTQLLAASCDSEYVHWAWRTHQAELTDLPFPMLADTKRELSGTLGIIDKQEGVAKRATYIIDPNGVVRHVSVNDDNVGRNAKEILRVVDALQTDELCPCNWNPGDKTIVPGETMVEENK